MIEETKKKVKIEKSCDNCYGRGWIAQGLHQRTICPTCLGEKVTVTFEWVDRDE